MNRMRWTQPCRTFVRPLAKVTTRRRGSDQQPLVRVLHAEDELPAGEVADREHRGDGQADGGEHRPQEDVDGPLQ